MFCNYHLRNAFAAGNAPDVINLSVGEGWVSEYATKDLLLNLDDNVPQSVKDVYFPGLWQEQLVGGKNFQFPWYNFVAVELINTQIYQGVPQVDADGKITGYTGGAGLKIEDFPKTIDGLPALCKTIKDKTGNNKMVIDSSKNSMTINVNGDFTVEAKGKVTIKSTQAMALESQATGSVKAMQLTVEGTAKAEVKAPTVSVAGQAMTEVKGGIVKIN